MQLDPIKSDRDLYLRSNFKLTFLSYHEYACNRRNEMNTMVSNFLFLALLLNVIRKNVKQKMVSIFFEDST